VALDREALMVALEARIRAGVPAFQGRVSRRFRTWGEVEASGQPACFVVLSDQIPGYSTVDAPPVWTVNVLIYVYARQDADPSSPQGTAITSLIDGVEAALEHQPADGGAGLGYPGIGSQTTLGGLCRWARVSGSIETDEGSLGDQVVAVIPVEIKAGG
jgi:glycogen debranching enzyme